MQDWSVLSAHDVDCVHGHGRQVFCLMFILTSVHRNARLVCA
mgnify:CR=1 FL=1